MTGEHARGEAIQVCSDEELMEAAIRCARDGIGLARSRGVIWGVVAGSRHDHLGIDAEMKRLYDGQGFSDLFIRELTGKRVVTVPTCEGCGKPSGTGTLLDYMPEPPRPSTTLHRLYSVMAPEQRSDVDVWTAMIGEDVWAAFAERYRCMVCAEYLKQQEQR